MSSSLLVVLLLAAPCAAQEWADKMFETRSHDFGTIARAAKAEFAFELTNLYLEDVHIASVRASCGCTTPRIEKETLKTYEKGAIIAHINSESFLGRQGATSYRDHRQAAIRGSPVAGQGLRLQRCAAGIRPALHWEASREELLPNGQSVSSTAGAAIGKLQRSRATTRT